MDGSKPAQTARIVVAVAEVEWCVSWRHPDVPALELSDSGQSGTLSRVAETRNIADASAMIFESLKNRFRVSRRSTMVTR